jgi:hypothetical protein
VGCNCGGKKSGVKYEVRAVAGGTLLDTKPSLSEAQTSGDNQVGRGNYTVKAVAA